MSLFCAHGEWIEEPTCRFFWQPKYLVNSAADSLFTTFKNELIWQQGVITFYGKKRLEPRLSAYYGDANSSYSYSGRHITPLAWHPELLALRYQLEQKFQFSLNAVLCNYYRNGQDCMGWHSDDEPELGNSPNIASISLGFSRRFILRERRNHHNKRVFTLDHGDLLIMAGPTQHFWQHHIPKTQKTISERINLTFRNIIT